MKTKLPTDFKTEKKLKPCHFCGHFPRIYFWDHSNSSKKNNCGHDIECLNEDCEFTYNTYYYPLTEEQVIKKWNTRASDEKLEKCLGFIRNFIGISYDEKFLLQRLDTYVERAEKLLGKLGEI